MKVSSNAQLDNRISLLVHDITQDNAIYAFRQNFWKR
jgi:hypothetical protein